LLSSHERASARLGRPGVFGSEIQRGWDVFEYTEDGAADRVRTRTLNAQTQFPLR
jgi:hypothetical protein